MLVYAIDGTGWRFSCELRPPEAHEYQLFGSSASVDGAVLVVGAQGQHLQHPAGAAEGSGEVTFESGAAHVYEHRQGAWQHVARLVPDSPRSASSLAPALR